MRNHTVAIGTGTFSNDAVSEAAGAVRDAFYSDPIGTRTVKSKHSRAIGADTLSKHTVGKTGGRVFKTCDSSTISAGTTPPHAVCGATGGTCNSATDSNTVDGLAIHACGLTAGIVTKHPNSIWAGVLPEYTVRESVGSVRNAVHAVPAAAGGMSEDTVDEAGGRCRVSVYPVGEAGSAHGSAEYPREVRALAVDTDSGGGISSDSSDTGACSSILAVHAVLVAGSGSGGREPDQAASACAADRSGHQTRPASILADQYHLVAGRATECGRRKHGPCGRRLRSQRIITCLGLTLLLDPRRRWLGRNLTLRLNHLANLLAQTLRQHEIRGGLSPQLLSLDRLQSVRYAH